MVGRGERDQARRMRYPFVRMTRTRVCWTISESVMDVEPGYEVGMKQSRVCAASGGATTTWCSVGRSAACP